MVRKNNNKVKKGFTIIEVVLVLAIAGLIFLMVFIALPALQRSQRNTQRRDDYSMLVTAINSYMSSNNGKIGNLLGGEASKQLQPERWVNSTGLDPSGNPYDVIVYANKAFTFGSDGDNPNPMPSDKLSAKITVDGEEYDPNTPASQVFIVIKANCNGRDQNGDPKPANDTANRSFAVYGYLEGGGYFCQASGSSGNQTSSE